MIHCLDQISSTNRNKAAHTTVSLAHPVHRQNRARTAGIAGPDWSALVAGTPLAVAVDLLAVVDKPSAAAEEAAVES